jgi:hypothetical protein
MLYPRPPCRHIGAFANHFLEDVQHCMVRTIADAMDVLTQNSLASDIVDGVSPEYLQLASHPSRTAELISRGLGASFA